MKKGLITTVVILCFIMVFTPIIEANSFKDVPEDHWAYDAIKNLASKGLISGYSSELFRGEKKISRYEIAVILNNVMKHINEKQAQKKKISIKTLKKVLNNNKAKVSNKEVREIKTTLKKLIMEFNKELKAVNNEIQIERSITLNVKEKDPRIAYSNSLTPIVGPQIAANYVRSTPTVNPYKGSKADLKNKANKQMIYNILEIGAGIGADILTNRNNVITNKPRIIDRISFTSIGVLVAVIHNMQFGEDMADYAVEYNKKLHEKFKWQYPNLINIKF